MTSILLDTLISATQAGMTLGFMMPLLDLISTLAASAILSTVSIGVAEVMRDVWHVACHRSPFLYRTFHRWHHIAYEMDFKRRSETLWRRSQWRHGLPEALMMILGTAGIWSVLDSSFDHWCVWAASAGLIYSVRELGFVILRGFGFNPKLDHLHVVTKYTTPPEQLVVNRPYHWKHHFAQPNAYFGAIYTPIDQIIGTALHLDHMTIAITQCDRPLETALAEQLITSGATVVNVHPDLDLGTVDILIVTTGDRGLPQQFFQTVHGNRDVACKELWWLHTTPMAGLPAQWEQERCTTRDIAVLHQDAKQYSAIAQQILFQAKRHVRYIVASNDPLAILLHRLTLVMNAVWVQYTKPYVTSCPELNHCDS
jgi:hypothetical protein